MGTLSLLLDPGAPARVQVWDWPGAQYRVRFNFRCAMAFL